MGALSFTGAAVTVGQIVSPAGGSLSFTGHDPSIQEGSNTAITPDQGSIAIAGSDMQVDQLLAVGSGSLSFTGHDVGSELVQVIAPGEATLNFTGHSVTITGVVVQDSEKGVVRMVVKPSVASTIQEVIH